MSEYTLGGVVAGLGLTACYVGWRFWGKRGTPDILHAFELLLGCLAGAGAIKLFVIAVTPGEVPPLDGEDRGYMVLGGVGVLWVSVLTVAQVFKRGAAERADDELAGG